MKFLWLLLQGKYQAASKFSISAAFFGSYASKKIHKPKHYKNNNSSDFQRILKKEVKGEILYGIHPITAALTARKREFYRLYISENVLYSQNENIKAVLEEVERLGVEVVIQKKFMLNHLSADRPHQGLCIDASVLEKIPYNREDVFSDGRDNRWLILDCIQDPMNFGSILRSSFFFGFNKIFINSRNSCSLTSTVSKASAGVMELCSVHSLCYMGDFVRDLKDHDWLVIGLTVSNSGSQIDLKDAASFRDKKVAIVLGNEGVGIEQSLEESCTAHIHIKPSPSLPPLSKSSSTLSSSSVDFHLDSLNVNVVAGIVLNAFSLNNNQ